MGEPLSDIVEQIASLRGWLFDRALPLWWEHGADHVRGGFHEKMDLDGTPVELPRRFRVISRQAFSYCEAGRLGWQGPWREASLWALDYLQRHFIGEDGTAVSRVAPDGALIDATFDLYNQAFALLAFSIGQCCEGADAPWRERAVRLRSLLNEDYAHPDAGYVEGGGTLPLRSNPHMHLLESSLAWLAIDSDPAWRQMADRIATLALERFIDPASGALREFFAADWSPAPGDEGRIAEPGHQYEWAFLLNRWALQTGRPRPPAISRLIAFAESHGVDRSRGVAFNSLLTDGSVHDAKARLWPQTERIRAYVADYATVGDAPLGHAIAGLQKYLDTKISGLWFDQLDVDDKMAFEPSPASSLYHIVGAVAELSNLA